MNIPLPGPADLPEIYSQLEAIPDDGAAALIGAMAMVMHSATEGECSGCPCDACVSIRGMAQGMRDLMGGTT